MSGLSSYGEYTAFECLPYRGKSIEPNVSSSIIENNIEQVEAGLDKKLLEMVDEVETDIDKIPKEDDYNGFIFNYDVIQNLWYTRVLARSQEVSIPFYFHPLDLESIQIDDNVGKSITSTGEIRKPDRIILSIPSDPDSARIAQAGIEIARITGERYNLFNIPTQSAISSYIEGLPYASCSNASEFITVIKFEKGLIETIHESDNRIHLQYTEDPIRLADRFVYRLLKIME